MYAFYLGLRYLLTRWINVLCVIGVVIATWALVVVVSVFAGFIDETLLQQRAGDPDISVLGASENASYQAFRSILKGVEGVQASAPRIVWHGLLYRAGDRNRIQIAGGREQRSSDHFYRLIGVDWRYEPEVSEISKWILQEPSKDPQELGAVDKEAPFRIDPQVIPRNRQNRFAHEWPGLLLPRRPLDSLYRPRRGQINQFLTGHRGDNGLASYQLEFVTTGSFRSGLYELDNSSAFVDIDSLRTVFGQDPFDEEPIDVFNEIAIRVGEGHKHEQVALAINAALESEGHRARAFTWQQRKARFLEAIAYERSMTKFVLFVLLVIAMFLVFAATSTMVTEKTHDIGILSALGATRRGLLIIFMFSGLVIGVVGSVLGIALGLITLDYLDTINDWFYFQQGLELFPRNFLSSEGIPYAIEPLWLAQVGIGAILSALLFSFLPAWRAARLDPVQALRY
ncbi:MAG: hypothetical protein CSA62_12900 [Planctomycetota bacterium]|nr:MAG: hypothetical protein CSA62_12900 [Planctomycetota bacterium]